METKALLFDLGGVLVDWDGTTPLVELSRGKIEQEQARRFWLQSVWVQKFETGRCTVDEFAAGCVKELSLDISPDLFIDEFATWDRGPFNGALQLIDELKDKFSVYCLSNNNSVHWKNAGIQSLVKLFNKVFVSFETGTMKPDRLAFTNVLEQVPEQPPQILFLDDNQECVDAAIHFGFQAKAVNGLSEVRKVLAAMRCLTNR